jgi:hypothetical protein
LHDPNDIPFKEFRYTFIFQMIAIDRTMISAILTAIAAAFYLPIILIAALRRAGSPGCACSF